MGNSSIFHSKEVNLIRKSAKIVFTSTIAALLVIGGSAAVYAQYSVPKAPGYVKLSIDEVNRMSDIIIAVNQGELPVSALKDAKPLIERNPNYLSQEVWVEYTASEHKIK